MSDKPSVSMPAGGPPDDWMTYRRYQYLLAKLLFFLLCGYIVYLVLAQVGGVLSMLFVSILAAYVLDPLVDWFEARGINRTTTIVCLVVLTIGVTALFVAWIVPTLVGEFAQAGERVHQAVSTDKGQLVAWVQDTFGVELSGETVEAVKDKAKEYTPTVMAAVGDFLKGAAARTMGVVGWLLNVVMIPVFVFYFLRDFDRMKGWIVEQIPARYRGRVVERGKRVDKVVGEWLRGQVEVALILAVLYAVGLFAVGVKLAIPIGILAGLLNVVPYLGFAFGFGLALLMVLLEWSGVGAIFGVVGVFVVAQILESYVLTPKIVGEKVGLSPVTVLIVLLLGGELFGLLGFVLAVPTAGALKTILLEVLDWYRSSEHFLAASDEPPSAEAEEAPAPQAP